MEDPSEGYSGEGEALNGGSWRVPCVWSKEEREEKKQIYGDGEKKLEGRNVGWVAKEREAGNGKTKGKKKLGRGWSGGLSK